MIIFDASFLVVYLQPNAEPAKDRNNNPVAHFRERVDHLVATLNASDQVIGIPTPALAEVMVRAGKGRFKYLSILSDSYRFEILPFGVRAAIEAGELIAKIKAEQNQPWATWAKLKFDVQIASIGKAEAVTAIYSDDKDIEAHCKRLNIRAIRICDLPLPPPPDPKKEAYEERMRATGTLFPDTESSDKVPSKETQTEVKDGTQTSEPPRGQESDEFQADPAHPTAVQGSDDRRSESETAREEGARDTTQDEIKKPADPPGGPK